MSSATAARTFSKPSCPCMAESIWKLRWRAAPAVSPKSAASSASSCSASLASPGPRILRKSSWIDGLSSMMRIRRFSGSQFKDWLFMNLLLRRDGKFERKGGAMARAGAVHVERATHGAGRDRSAVQSEAVAIFASSEAVRENAGEIFGGDAYAIIGYDDAHGALVGGGDGNGDALVRAVDFVERVFGVSNQVDKNLQDFVPVDPDQRNGGEAPLDVDAMALESADVHRDRVFDQLVGMQIFKNAADFGVTLLHGDDFLDVLDVAPELIDLIKEVGVFGHQKFSELGEISWELLSDLIVGEIISEITVARSKKGGCFRQFGRLRAAQFLHHQARGDIDAVQDVSDVVQDPGRNFRHAREARSLEQLLLGMAQGLFGLAPLGNIAHHTREILDFVLRILVRD